MFHAFLPFSCFTFYQTAHPPGSTKIHLTSVFFFISLLRYPHPSHYYLLSGFFSQPPKCDPCCLCLFLSCFLHFSHSSYIKWKYIWSLPLQLIINWIPNSFLVLQCPASPYLVAHLLSLLQSKRPPFSSWNSPSCSVVELFFLGSFFVSAQNVLYPLHIFFCMAESSFRYQLITSEK